MPPPAHPAAAAAVVPSRCPSRDARALAALAGPRFARPCDARGAPGGAFLVLGPDAAALPPTLPPTAVLFVDFGAPDPPEARGPNAGVAAPNATLAVDAGLVAAATDPGAAGDAGIAVVRRSDRDRDGDAWAVLRLGGGGTLLLVSSVQAACDYARAVDRGDVDREDGAAAELEREAPPYAFPSLRMSVLSDTRVLPGFRINTRSGVPIDSDLFVGRVLLVLRPPDPTDDPYWNEKVFSQKKRRFEIQIQGRFKYVPTGTVWCGFEVTEEMKLGLIARGLCNLLLRLVAKTVPGDMHFSFGDKNNEEYAHISFPAWNLFDRIVVTPPGEDPPPLGDVLPEPAAAALARKRSGDAGEYNTQDTYSFSYHSMYLDLSIWRVVNLPVADMDLHTFWRDSLLRIVVYENGGRDARGRHPRADNRYVAGIQAEYVGFEDGSLTDRLEEGAALPPDTRRLASVARSLSAADLGASARSVGTAELGAGSEHDAASLAPSAAPSAPSSGGWDGRDPGAAEDSDGDDTVFYDAASVPRIEEGAEGGPGNLLLYDRLCPGWIDACADARGKYHRVYAFARVAEGTVAFRTGAEFAQIFPLSEAKRWAEDGCSPRLSGAERHRRIMGRTLAACGRTASAPCEQRCHKLWSQPVDASKHAFLRRAPPADAKVKKGEVFFSGYVGRALSERHWIEEWAVVTDGLVAFYHPHHKRPAYRIRLRGILDVRELQGAERPYFPSYHFLAVATVSRVVYVMHRSREGCLQMLRALQRRPGPQEGASRNGDLSPLTFDDPSEEYLHKSSLYKCEHRRLLNNRKFAFDSLGKIGFHEREVPGVHPLTLVQDVLRKVLVPNLMDVTDKAVLDDFLDAASELKSANLAGLGETERMAFYINLYHVMLHHGFLVFGTPLTLFEFVHFFGKVAYEVGDDVMSLKELEHNILRAHMTSPSQFVGRFVLPKQVFRHALRRGDYRLNFALNCGSLSNPGTIQVFTAAGLESQLEAAARDCLAAAKVSASGRGLTLPKICQWYANDFGKGRSQDVAVLVVKYLSAHNQKLLPPSLSDVRVRHFGYDYKCRHLKLAGT